MKAFAALYRELDATTSSLAKQAALRRYLQDAAPADAAWAVYFLAGGKPRQLVASKVLRQMAQDAAGLPEWLFDESYDSVGDLAETMALLLPPPTGRHDIGLATWIEQHLLPLRKTAPDDLPELLRQQWSQLALDERLVYFKLITGGFRVGVSRLQVTQALAAVAGVDAKRVAQRLMGYTHISGQPSAADYAALVALESPGELNPQTSSQPYPFFLAHPFNQPLDQFDMLLGPPQNWIIEWKWDGIRAQLVKRAGQVWLWSRGEELLTERFPELAAMGAALPDGTVLDGEIVVWRGNADQPGSEGSVQPFADLQKRIGRKTLGAKLLRDIPVVLLAYDLLEWQQRDVRGLPQSQRRVLLDALLTDLRHPALLPSPLLEGESWQVLARQRESARSMGVEGMMLKQRDAPYGVGRTKDVGLWWKWKIDPLSIDAVLIYAQRGHGRRASLYSDYTFAVWDGPPEQLDRMLVPFAKAYSGLSDAEMARVDAIIRKTTVESFGPVRSVKPTLVFELGFEGIARSPRHKSGIAVRFPRMLRWREDKPVLDADTLQTLSALLPG
ncbi:MULTISPECIES: ATP-dependent DNA ligase [unclassified Polaromonas]|uniref:ATP-dependent DNA ligase n=1 Tax=unclassified Polaromonas TaxID=2638319 RepID=UPI0018CA4B3F|nr:MULTISPECIES: ATP-dependent DNA ligase [unclassified Polaromonas]MBG6072343.1 DNA ligase-1 [Polaromonas sp. CG_9.7]MBG6114226.1 DNA ligase-1 [Polaromonas sp. CG_9.2]MDH6182816.1 DNA ligase-1 [Polaromonas sp. CG_23.6]